MRMSIRKSAMNANGNSQQGFDAYLSKFQESVYNLNTLIREERIRKRIDKSKKKSPKAYG